VPGVRKCNGDVLQITLKLSESNYEFLLRYPSNGNLYAEYG